MMMAAGKKPTAPKPAPKAAAPKKKYNSFGVEITAADEARMKADDARYSAARTKAAASPPKYSQADIQKAALDRKRKVSDDALKAAEKGSLGGRRKMIDNLIKKG
jgi:hypothetical protein